MSAPDTVNGSAEWMQSPLGNYLLEREQTYYDSVVADIFGYNAFQMGLPELDLLRASRIPLRCRVGVDGDVDVRTDFRDLAIATNSADLVLLPHVLEFAEHPHQILREVARVLMPEAHVVISGFNPFSLWGFRRMFHRAGDFPWRGRFITLMRVKDWLALLGFETHAMSASEFTAYVRSEVDKWARVIKATGLTPQ